MGLVVDVEIEKTLYRFNVVGEPRPNQLQIDWVVIADDSQNPVSGHRGTISYMKSDIDYWIGCRKWKIIKTNKTELPEELFTI